MPTRSVTQVYIQKPTCPSKEAMHPLCFWLFMFSVSTILSPGAMCFPSTPPTPPPDLSDTSETDFANSPQSQDSPATPIDSSSPQPVSCGAWRGDLWRDYCFHHLWRDSSCNCLRRDSGTYLFGDHYPNHLSSPLVPCLSLGSQKLQLPRHLWQLPGGFGPSSQPYRHSQVRVSIRCWDFHERRLWFQDLPHVRKQLRFLQWREDLQGVHQWVSCCRETVYERRRLFLFISLWAGLQWIRSVVWPKPPGESSGQLHGRNPMFSAGWATGSVWDRLTESSQRDRTDEPTNSTVTALQPYISWTCRVSPTVDSDSQWTEFASPSDAQTRPFVCWDSWDTMETLETNTPITSQTWAGKVAMTTITGTPVSTEFSDPPWVWEPMGFELGTFTKTEPEN